MPTVVIGEFEKKTASVDCEIKLLKGNRKSTALQDVYDDGDLVKPTCSLGSKDQVAKLKYEIKEILADASLSSANGFQSFCDSRAHFTCMVDLLGREGKLVEALDLIKSMPLKPLPVIFGALLGACRSKNLELAKFATRNLLDCDPSNAAGFVQLANVYAPMRKWD
ncbi:hypothetical protein L6452_02282 [Arctium lappa]|uniref:Uncharacterized protein n=1 Tax=Arctium lappa TaxID=4217 RepID=A0ACB9FJ42_ARCLA|nr:hypothetical protein L6452_02282 [Arctium lappa]